jgi:hypothetical protein
MQYLGKFFARDCLIIAKTFSEAPNKLEIRMHEIGTAVNPGLEFGKV